MEVFLFERVSPGLAHGGEQQVAPEKWEQRGPGPHRTDAREAMARCDEGFSLQDEKWQAPQWDFLQVSECLLQG